MVRFMIWEEGCTCGKPDCVAPRLIYTEANKSRSNTPFLALFEQLHRLDVTGPKEHKTYYGRA